MNLFIKSANLYLFFLVTTALKPAVSLGNTPPSAIRAEPTYSEVMLPEGYNITATTSICRDRNGTVFIGKENGIVFLDNGTYQFTPTNQTVFLVSDSNKTVYYLTGDDFGILTFQPSEGLVFKSRKNELEVHFTGFLPQEIISLGEKVFMATSEGIFMLSPDDAKHWLFDRKVCKFYKTPERLYLEIKDKGWHYWDGEQFSSIPKVPTEVNLYGRMNLQKRAIALNDSLSISLFKRDLQLSQLTATGQVKMLFSLEFSHNLNAAYLDHFGDVWIASDFNLFKINIHPGVIYYDLQSDLQESVISAAMLGERLYLGTKDRLYLVDMSSIHLPASSVLLEEQNNLFDQLQVMDSTLFFKNRRGIFEVSQSRVQAVYDEEVFSLIALGKDRLLSLSECGLIQHKRAGDGWKKELLGTLPERIINSCLFKDALYMISPTRLYQLDLRSGEIQNINLNLPSENGVPELISFKGELYALGLTFCQKWNPSSKSFSPSSDLLLHPGTIGVEAISEKKGRLWYGSRNSNGDIDIYRIPGKQKDFPFLEIAPDRSPGALLSFFPLNESIIAIGSREMILMDSIARVSSSSLAPRIHAAFLKKKEADSPALALSNGDKIRFNRSDLEIVLKDLRYIGERSPYFRSRLLGLQNEWSDWSREKVIRFDQLSPGQYHFEAQSASFFGETSDPVRISFTITPPIYRKWYAYMVYLLLISFAAFLIYKWRLLNLQKVEVKVQARLKEKMESVLQEKQKSDKLVEDLFPKGTADELKAKGRAKSKKFEMATVLFSDIQGFTRIAEEMNPEVLIDELDKFFFHFDTVVDKYNIEKIKTIGDAYMAAGGIPVKNSSNPVEVVLAGLEMQHYMNDLKKKKADIWDLRIGIHTGPVISGVVGHKKLSYDIWGDTVNTASRMESSGEGGKVNISGVTYNMVKDYFLCEYRGKLPVKYKGNIDMYFVKGLRPELSINLQGIPNKRFFNKLQLLRVQDLENYLFEVTLADQLPNLHFHKKEFIQKVTNQAELLGRSENIYDDEMVLIQTAALMIFAGLAEGHENMETRSAEMAQTLLPDFKFSEKQINSIMQLILATKEPFNPQNILEKILIDARMEYIGRADYATQIKLLFLEKKSMGKEISREKLIKEQVAILKYFRFYTLAAQRLREVPAEDQIGNLESWK